jgi:hypothetical protein
VGRDPSGYLDAAERLVRACVPYQQSDGMLHEPSVPEDHDTGAPRLSPGWMVRHSYAGTARFVGAVARLVMAGRGTDLSEAGMRALDWNARTLWEGRDAHRPGAEFEMIELVDGFRAFEPLAEPARSAQWRGWLGGIDPESCYGDVFAERAEPRNGNTFAVASEQARVAAGLGGSPAFVDRYLAYQRRWFDPAGMYRDPGEPMTYDLTVRKNLVLLLRRGYRGVHAGWIEDALERGGRFSLASQSAAGVAPFGGRSSQYLFVEATLACVLEHEARRHAARGDAASAGAYARAGRAALDSARPWLAMDPPRHIRNAFDPATRHGIDSYGFFPVYAPLAATLFAEAWHLADPGIDEGPGPGGGEARVFAPGREFRKVFAACRGWSLEAEMAADPGYDATGIGLLHRRGVPLPLALTGPCPGQPRFFTSVPSTAGSVAIGPAWRTAAGGWRTLASCVAADVAAWDWEARRADGGVADFTLAWRLGGTGTVAIRVTERIVMDGDSVRVTASVEGDGVDAVAFLVPMLETDGGEPAALAAEPDDTATCRSRGAVFSARCPGAVFAWEPGRAVNRNGVYRVARWEVAGGSIACVLRLAAV